MVVLRFKILVLAMLLGVSSSLAQDSSSVRPLQLKYDLQFGMLAGGQVVNENFIYKPGVIGQLGVNAKISSWIYAGLGVGLQSLEEETILPVFLDLKAHFREGDRSSFIGLNIGTSSAWSDDYRRVTEFEYEGGFYFSPYYSFQFPLSEKMNLLVVTGLIHQIGEIELHTEFHEDYDEKFAMDFFTVRAGIRF